MFRKLRIKFIAIATLSMIIVLSMVLFLVNLITYRNALEGVFDTVEFISSHSDSDMTGKDFKQFRVSPETQFETRYITVIVDESNTMVTFNKEHIAAIEDSEVESFVSYVTGTRSRRGIFIYDGLTYAYLRVKDEGNVDKITIMDCTRNLYLAHSFRIISLYIGVITILLFVLIMSIFARKAVQPMVNNIEAQKQFITNASHELKTPLAVISANTEVMEMMNGKSEWTESTINQVNRMSELISQLVVLSKLEEREDLVLVDVDFSGEADKVVSSFKTVAETQGKRLEADIAENVNVKADEKGIHELLNILVDNAVKYCDEEGLVKVTLHQKGKTAVLTVSNDYIEGEGEDYRRFFDRFYRADESHNNEKKGFGIGLSMADSLVRMFGGRINVTYKKPQIIFTVII